MIHIIKKQIIIPALVLTVVGGMVFGTGYVSAQSADDHNTTLIQKLVQRFGLKTEDVQAVFNEQRQEHQANMQAKAEERLTQAVTDGKLTESQKQLILAKQKELQAARETEMENFKNMTEEQRKTQMEAKRQELKAWAEQNNIDLRYVMGMGGRGRGVFGPH